METNKDDEIKAIISVVSAIQELSTPDKRSRVIKYLYDRYAIQEGKE